MADLQQVVRLIEEAQAEAEALNLVPQTGTKSYLKDSTKLASYGFSKDIASLKLRVIELEEENRRLKAGLPVVPEETLREMFDLFESGLNEQLEAEIDVSWCVSVLNGVTMLQHLRNEVSELQKSLDDRMMLPDANEYEELQ